MQWTYLSQLNTPVMIIHLVILIGETLMKAELLINSRLLVAEPKRMNEIAIW
jgi:hypothetical protein